MAMSFNITYSHMRTRTRTW